MSEILTFLIWLTKCSLLIAAMGLGWVALVWIIMELYRWITHYSV